MHHYPHHIGDYRTHTAHLTMLEDGAYRRLLDIYYMHERPLPADIAAVQRLASARTKEERAAVEAILREFFALEDDGWHQGRADEEIGSYQARVNVARENGRRSAGRPTTGNKPKGKPMDNQVGYSTDSQSEPGDQLTVNREPVTDNQETKAKALVGASAQKPKRKTTLPKDWEATEEQLAYAAKHGSRDPADTAQRFKLNHLSKGTLGVDWDLGFQYWCRNEKRFNGNGSYENASDKRTREVRAAIERSKEFDL